MSNIIGFFQDLLKTSLPPSWCTCQRRGTSPRWYLGTGIPDLPCGGWWSSLCLEVSWDLLRSNQPIKYNGHATIWIDKINNYKGRTSWSLFNILRNLNLIFLSTCTKTVSKQNTKFHALNRWGNCGTYPWCRFCGGPVLEPSDRSLCSSLGYTAVPSTCHWTASGPGTGSTAVAFLNKIW